MRQVEEEPRAAPTRRERIARRRAAARHDDDQHGATAPLHAWRAAPRADAGWRDDPQGAPEIGYLHTGIEKTAESKSYFKALVLTDRMDYLAPLCNNLGYSLAVEKLLGVEAPPKAQYARVVLAELQRIASHLVWLGSSALDLGAQSVFLYCFRERELILDIFELCSGVRMMTSYIMPGGLQADLPPTLRREGARRSSTSSPSGCASITTC